MKKIIGIVFASLMFANIGFAEMRLIEDKVLGPSGKGSYYVLTTFCIDGYKFVLLHSKFGNVMIQFFEERDGKSLPAKC